MVHRMVNLYEIHNLKQQYEKGRPNLDIEELFIKKSAVTGLAGPNGCGKSSLLKVLSFLIPYKGEILFDGKPCNGIETELRRNVTYMLQSPFLLSRSVFDNIAYGLKIRKDIADIAERVNDSLELVGLNPESFAHRKWYQLSGGEVQRVALAARLALRPKALLLDEPTANVDEASAALVMKASLMAVEKYGTTVIISTHDRQWLNEAAENIVYLKDGRIVK